MSQQQVIRYKCNMGDGIMVKNTALRKQFSFESFPPELIQISGYEERLERLGTPMNVSKNFLLFKAGDLPDSCYLIKEGRINSSECTYNGREHIFGSNGKGSLILLPSVILGHKLTLDFRASVASKLIRIHRETLMSEIYSDPGLAVNMIYILSEKFIEVNEQFRAGSNRIVPWKVCNLLLSLAERSGVEYDGKILIKEKYSQQMMADYLHANRVTIVRAIKELMDFGLLERINDYYCIRSLEKLQKHMDYMDRYVKEN